MRISKEQSAVLKGIAIWIMASYHIMANGLGDIQALLYRFWHDMQNWGNICVKIFAFISIYGLSLKLKKTEIKYGNFCIVRLLRLYQSYIPTFIVVFIGCVLSTVGIIHNQYNISIQKIYGNGISAIGHIIINMLGLTNIIYGDSIYTMNQTWWYMSLAILIIIMTPIYCWLFKKIGWLSVIITTIICVLFPIKYVMDLVLIALGSAIVMSDNELLQKEGRKKLLTLLVSVVIIGLWFLYKLKWNNQYHSIIDSYVSILIIYVLKETVTGLSYITKWFSFWGKHSGNIFYIHSMIYLDWPSGYWIYKLKYGALVLMMVMALSVSYSMIVDFVKERTGWNSFIGVLCSKVK